MNFSAKLTFFLISSLFIFFAALMLLYLTEIISFEYINSVTLAYLLTTINALFGFYFVKMGMSKAEKTFIKWILGGLAIRMFLTLVIVVFILVFLEINRISFIFSILFFYVYYLVTEIVFLNFRSNY